MSIIGIHELNYLTLNESPSEKEGKCVVAECAGDGVVPSMKVPPKRKGNLRTRGASPGGGHPSMKVPPKRKGNVVANGF